MVMGAGLAMLTASAVVSGCSAEASTEGGGETAQAEENLDNAKCRVETKQFQYPFRCTYDGTFGDAGNTIMRCASVGVKGALGVSAVVATGGTATFAIGAAVAAASAEDLATCLDGLSSAISNVHCTALPRVPVACSMSCGNNGGTTGRDGETCVCNIAPRGCSTCTNRGNGYELVERNACTQGYTGGRHNGQWYVCARPGEVNEFDAVPASRCSAPTPPAPGGCLNTGASPAISVANAACTDGYTNRRVNGLKYKCVNGQFLQCGAQTSGGCCPR
jgi:hypothetical protein